MRKNDVSQSKTVPLSSAKVLSILIILSLVFSFLIPSVISDPAIMTPQPIYGAAEYSTGGPADGAYVEVTSSLGTVTTYVGPAGGWNSGYWQVDVGDPGPNWPDGTSFTVIISNNTGWESNPVTDTVDPSGNNMGTIVLLPPPVNATASATPTTVEVGDPVSFSASATGGITPYTYHWDFGDGNTSTDQNPTHSYQQNQTFTATLTVTDSNSNSSSDTVDITVFVSDLSVNASADSTLVEKNTAVSFSGSATGGSTPYSWNWDFGDGYTSTEQNPSHSYSSTGDFSVILTVTDDYGSTANDTLDITVYNEFIIETNGPYEATILENISFNATVSGGTSPYSYEWDFGNGETREVKDVSYNYSNPGVYTVIFTVEDNEGITESVETNATIYTDHINITLDVPDNATETEPVQFSATASNGVEPYNWSWDFGDGNTSTEQNPTHTFATYDNYTITLNVTDALGISNEVSTTIEILKKATLDIDAGGPYEGAIDYPVSFSGSVEDGTPPYSWYWKFGDGATSTDQYPVHTYSNPGQYTVSLTVTDNENRLGKVNTTVTISQNYAPAKPTVSGTFKGDEDRRYTYTIATNDPDGDTVYFYVDWGDGENSGWIGPYNSGEQVRVNHIWDDDGSYLLKVKAKDPYDAESDWTINEVRMPYNVDNPFINLLEQLSMRFPFLEPFFTIIINILIR